MKDAELIKNMGGITAVAKALGFSGVNGARRVSNWNRRGIPSKVKLEHQKLFEKAAKSSNKTK